MAQSQKFKFNYLSQNQVSKDLLVNENFNSIDQLMWLSLSSMGLTTPPATPEYNAGYVVGNNATDEWKNQDGMIAVFNNSTWKFFTPTKGLCLYCTTSNGLFAFDGTNWNQVSNSSQHLTATTIGLNSSSPTDSERLIVSSPLSSFVSDCDTRIRINKGATTNNASIIYNDNYKGVAEVGLLGDDNYTINVSSSGANFIKAMYVENSTGRLFVQNGSYVSGGIQFANNNQILSTYDFGYWTPTFCGSSVAGSTTYNGASGDYFIIGKMVFLNFYISAKTSLSEASGTLCIGGLPFSPTGSCNFIGSAIGSNLNNNVCNCCAILSTSPLINLVNATTNYSNLPLSACIANSKIMGSITYRTN